MPGTGEDERLRPHPRWRELKDPRVIRALAHPLRLTLMELLSLEDELTATEAGELTGESPANCSFHLRQLAKYGFIEEAPRRHGRQRPWRVKTVAMHLSDSDGDETGSAVAARELASIVQERALERLRNWWRTRSAYPHEWREAAQASQARWWVTSAELEQLWERQLEIVFAFHERIDDPSLRPPGAAPVEFLGFAYPLRPPGHPRPAN